MWVNCPLWVSQLSLSSLRGQWMSSGDHWNGRLGKVVCYTCGCMAAGQSSWVRAWLWPRLNAVPVCDAQSRWCGLRCYIIEPFLYRTFAYTPGFSSTTFCLYHLWWFYFVVYVRLRPDALQRHQDGNIRRFTSDDDADDNATWNGNSTQQMWRAPLPPT